MCDREGGEERARAAMKAALFLRLQHVPCRMAAYNAEQYLKREVMDVTSLRSVIEAIEQFLASVT